MIFQLNNFIAKRGRVIIEPFNITGNDFSGAVQKEESGLYSTNVKKQKTNELGEIEFIFQWDIKIGESSLYTQLKYTFSYENEQEKPTEEEFMSVLNKSWDEANGYFNDEIVRRNININYPRDKEELSMIDKRFALAVLDRAFD
jgi:hypothetical protein